MFKTKDAAAVNTYLLGQQVHIEKRVNETIYTDILYPSLIPVDTSANPMTQTVVYYSSDKYGQAGWINGNSDDIPLAGSEKTAQKAPVYTAAIGYGFGWEEAEVAMLMGQNIQADDALAARRAYEEMVERVSFVGDAAKGMNGLINYTGIETTAAAKAWETATEDEILRSINELLLGSNTTGTMTLANTLLLPPKAANYLASTRLGDTTMTLLDFIRTKNTYTAMTGQNLIIRGLPSLQDAGGGTTTRAIAYRLADDVLKLHLPMPHQFLQLHQVGALRWEVPGVFRLGGLDIRKKSEVRYLDGI